jgi:hypothetical protein
LKPTITSGLVLALLCAGCAAHVHYPYVPAERSDSASANPEPVIPYDRVPVPFHNSVLESSAKKSYEVRHIRIPSWGENGQPGNEIEALYYRSHRPGPLPLAIVLPIYGAREYPPTKIARALRARSGGGLHVLHVLSSSYVFDWEALNAAATEEEFLDLMQRMMLRDATNAVDVSRMIDWAEVRTEVDPERIGVVALSHSAIVGGSVAVNEDRPRAMVMFLGGAYVHKILARCNGGRVEDLRLIITERFGWTDDEYEKKLEPIFMTYDPTRFPLRMDPSRILTFDAGNDECMPPESREDFWVAMGRPERYTLKYKHKASFMSMTALGAFWAREKIYEFLDEQLEIDETSPSGSLAAN